MQRQRYGVLDSYRFIAALGIVVYHFDAHFAVFLPPHGDALDRFQTLVDFFFVLSGFVLRHTYGTSVRDLATYGDFLRKRLARVYPLQLATVLVCVGLYGIVKLAAIPVRDPSIIDMQLVAPNLLLVQAWGWSDHSGLNGPSWSISAEAFVYLLFPLFVAATVRLRPVRTLALAVLIALAVEGLRTAAGLPTGFTATFDFGAIRAVPMFLAGVATYEIVVATPPRPLSWLVPHALFAVIVVLMIAKAPYFVIDALYPLLVALIALAERGGRRTVLASGPLRALGNASFAIYMTHTFVQIACVGLVRHFAWTSPAALVMTAIGGTALIVLAGLASFTVFETPLRRWLGGPSPSSGTARHGTLSRQLEPLG